MGAVAEDALPVYSTANSLQHLQHLPPSLVRRRKLIVAVILFFGLSSLIFCNLRLFVRQPAQVPITLDIDSHPTIALSPLELEAEKVYHLGSLSLPDYNSSLQAFIDATFPSPLKLRLSKQLHRFLDFESADSLPQRPKIIWQTNNYQSDNTITQSWRWLNPDYEYHFLYDEDAEEWVKRHFKDSAIEWTWNFLPQAVLVSTVDV
jgi:hypothetical protein